MIVQFSGRRRCVEFSLFFLLVVVVRWVFSQSPSREYLVESGVEDVLEGRVEDWEERDDAEANGGRSVLVYSGHGLKDGHQEQLVGLVDGCVYDDGGQRERDCGVKDETVSASSEENVVVDAEQMFAPDLQAGVDQDVRNRDAVGEVDEFGP